MKKTMKNCCRSNNKDKICIRKSDGKIFKLPRRFSIKKCKNPKGFTMRSSCAPYKDCYNKVKKTKKIKTKKKSYKGGLTYKKNILGNELKVCSTNPMIGYYRNGYCMTGEDDLGTHTVCAKMNKKFLNYTKKKGNDLSSVVKPGDKWCLCEYRWNEAFKDGKAPGVIKSATNMRTKKNIVKNILITNNKDKKKKIKNKIAYFSGGCFWSLESSFKDIDGIIETIVGYMGGRQMNKKITYDIVSTGRTNFAETVKIVYNPIIVSFSELVNFFFSIHDPTTLNKQGSDIGKQYRSIAFYSNNSEKNIIEEFIDKSPKNIVTEIKKKMRFYKAEEKHQNYVQKKECLNPKTENTEMFYKICKNNTDYAEPKFSGIYVKKPYVNGNKIGIYICPCCKNKLYSHKDAFDSETGWPSFSNIFDKKGLSKSKHITYNKNTKELKCSKCGLHLGHRSIKDKKMYDCINSTCIHFVEK